MRSILRLKNSDHELISNEYASFYADTYSSLGFVHKTDGGFTIFPLADLEYLLVGPDLILPDDFNDVQPGEFGEL